MSEQGNTSFFRKKSLDRISSPEQLTDYLRVTNPGIWIFLAAVVVLLATFKQMKAVNGSMALANVGESFKDVLENTGLDAVFGM